MTQKRKTILVIDDDPVLRIVIYNFLLSAGYHAVQYDNPNDGINFAISHKPDLILMDYVMPGSMYGIDAANILKRNVITANIPIIIISANKLESNPYICLRKPLNQYELHETIKKYLNAIQM